jgi:hypothetical protein
MRYLLDTNICVYPSALSQPWLRATSGGLGGFRNHSPLHRAYGSSILP